MILVITTVKVQGTDKKKKDLVNMPQKNRQIKSRISKLLQLSESGLLVYRTGLYKNRKCSSKQAFKIPVQVHLNSMHRLANGHPLQCEPVPQFHYECFELSAHPFQ